MGQGEGSSEIYSALAQVLTSRYGFRTAPNGGEVLRVNMKFSPSVFSAETGLVSMNYSAMLEVLDAGGRSGSVLTYSTEGRVSHFSVLEARKRGVYFLKKELSSAFVKQFDAWLMSAWAVTEKE